MSAGAVANDGMVRNSGEKKSESKNKIAETTDVSPLLPPSETPEDDSTKVVMVDVPRQAPTVVPTASAKSAPFILGSFPSLSSIFAFVAQPIIVPKVSKISTKRKANIITIKLRNPPESNDEKSICIKVGAIDEGIDTVPFGIRL